jgi:H+/Cl- antiporter ClcA
MVAGAAAGVAAIFKSPATGAVFALEVPYQDDNASRMLLPALLASAVSYLTFVTFAGTAPLFGVAGTPPFDLRDLGGAVAIGLVCGIGARVFARVLRLAKRLSNAGHPAVRVVAAGATLAGLYALTYAVYGEGYSLGAGYTVIEWATRPDQTIGLIALLFVIRLAAVSTTVAGGGVGGLFVPLVVAGALTGRGFAALLGDPTGSLFLVIGVAAFLGAGYRTPLAGVIFVAESTGQPGFVVPGLLASVAAQLMMGGVSVSPYQRGRRVGRVDERREPIGRAVDPDWPVTRPGTTVEDLLEGGVADPSRPLPVVAGHRYLGVVTEAELHRVPHADRSTTLVTSVMRHDWPTARPSWPARTVAPMLEAAGVDSLAVTDDEGHWVGWLTADALAR